MVLSSGLYMFNVLCAIIPCSATQPPPEAYIGDHYNATTSSISPFIDYRGREDTTLEKRIDPLFIDENLVGNENNLRRKRLGEDESISSRSAFPSSPTDQVRNVETRSYLQQPRFQTPREFARRPAVRQRNIFSNGLFARNPIFSAVPAIPVLLGTLMRSMNSNDNSGSRLLGNFIGVRSARASTNEISLPNGGATFDPPVVETNSGKMEGHYMGTMKGRRISAFEGIPFAEPPLGNFRFRSPVTKFPWKSTLKATKTGPKCLQGHPLDFFQVTGSEDCLYLNVYTPQTPNSKLNRLPIVFFIHGGSFHYGAGSEYGPSYLLDEDVVLVTTNYRLGPLGFLSTGDDASPGNYGLKDQALALKWAYENAESFGGDNSRITIMGQSAGGVSAHLHLTSNKTTQYFKNGVSLSGSGFGFWPIMGRRRSNEINRKLAAALNCPDSPSAALIRCLRGQSASWITSAQLQVYDWIPLHPIVLFGPTIEAEGPEAFLTKKPKESYERNEVMNKTWIFGQTSQEGHFNLYFIKLLMQSAPIALNGRKYLPKILDYEFYTRQPQTADITKKVLQFYGGSMGFAGIDMEYLSDMITDRIFTSTIRKAIEAHSLVASTYAYIFDYKGKYSLGPLFGSSEPEWGVGHTEDLFYFFNSSAFHHGLMQNDEEYSLSQIMTDLLANFASEGKPTHMTSDGKPMSIWTPALTSNFKEPQTIQYLSIQKEIKMISDPFEERVAFWDSLRIPEK